MVPFTIIQNLIYILGFTLELHTLSMHAAADLLATLRYSLHS